MTFRSSLRWALAFGLTIGAPPVCASQPGPRTLTETAGPFHLTAAPLRIALPVNASMRAALEQSNETTVYLVVRGLRARHEPGTTFALYVGLPETSSAEERQVHRIGSLNFFGIADQPTNDREGSAWRSFELPRRQVLVNGRLDASIAITIEANGAPAAEAEATIDSIAIVQSSPAR